MSTYFKCTSKHFGESNTFELKSIHSDINNIYFEYISVCMIKKIIPCGKTAKYHDITFDTKVH